MIWLLSLIELLAAKFRQYQEERRQKEELDEMLREASAITSRDWSHNRYSYLLCQASGKTEQQINDICTALQLSPEDVYRWYMVHADFPPLDAVISIRHFGVSAISRAIITGARDNT